MPVLCLLPGFSDFRDFATIAGLPRLELGGSAHARIKATTGAF
jgi:hypothetical protein